MSNYIVDTVQISFVAVSITTIVVSIAYFIYASHPHNVGDVCVDACRGYNNVVESCKISDGKVTEIVCRRDK
jgi:hypothetical protein